MAKSSFMSNSAKLLAVVSGLLLLANFLVSVGSLEGYDTFATWGTKISNLSLYVVLVLGYIAFNGEGVGHKRSRDRKSKKITGFLKLILFFCFILRYIKGAPEMAVLSLPADSVGGITARFVMSLVSTVGSYGFLLGAVSLWYVFRDNGKKELMPIEIVSFSVSVLYNVFKLFNYAVGKYGITLLGDVFTGVFSQSNVLHVLCLLQFFFNLLMFIVVAKHYGKIGAKEQKVLDDNTKELSRARNVFRDDGYGIDTFEDDFLTSQTE